MCALKSNLKKYTAIFLLYYILRCIAIVSTHPPGMHINQPVGYDINWPHSRHFLIANSNDGEYWQMPSREQHPWERRPFQHNHGQIFYNNLNSNAHRSESRSSEECAQGPTESKAVINTPIHAFAHRDRLFPATRLNGNALDTEVVVNDLHHPWRVQWPHRRHRFHHRRWHAGHFEPDTDELSEEDEQVGTNADGAKIPGNNWRENVEPIETSGGSQNKEAEMDSTTAYTSTAKETTAPITTTTTSISEESTTLIEKATNSQEVQTTTAVNSPTTSATDSTATSETTEAALSIDLRSGFA